MTIKNYALIKDSTILNIIAIETLTSSLEESLLENTLADSLVLIDESYLQVVQIGTPWNGTDFVPQHPLYSSWNWDNELRVWVPPVPEPKTTYNQIASWNEETQEWVIVSIPT
jgi:hypothetical protein